MLDWVNNLYNLFISTFKYRLQILSPNYAQRLRLSPNYESDPMFVFIICVLVNGILVLVSILVYEEKVVLFSDKCWLWSVGFLVLGP